MKRASYSLNRRTSASKSTGGVPDAQQSLPWTQGSIYTNLRENMPLVDGVLAISEWEGECVAGGLEMRDRVPRQQPLRRSSGSRRAYPSHKTNLRVTAVKGRISL